jgi:hypothetical protein
LATPGVIKRNWNSVLFLVTNIAFLLWQIISIDAVWRSNESSLKVKRKQFEGQTKAVWRSNESSLKVKKMLLTSRICL